MEIFYKPTCITCKKTLSEIDRLKLDWKKRDIFKDKLSESEIKKILKLTGLKPQQLLRKRDKMFKELDLEQKKKGDSELIKLMAKNPGLIKRPIIISKKKTLVGKFNFSELKKL